MTLIEVLAGLALLAALLMAVLTARTRAALQWTRANERLRAVHAADRLLTEWWRHPRDIPREGEGAISGAADLRWRTRVVPSRGSAELGAEIVRLEVGRFAPGGNGGDFHPAAVAVEVLLPVEESAGFPAAPGAPAARGLQKTPGVPGIRGAGRAGVGA